MSRPSLRTCAMLVLLTAGVAAGAATLAAGPESTDEVTDVKIDNFSFAPQTVTVTAGTSVRWTNGDDIPHAVVSEDKSFRSKALDTDDQFTHTFAKPGTYKYFCSLHPRMTGTVIVQ